MLEMPNLDVHALTADRWDDLELLFGPTGAYSGCWCMFLRESAKSFATNCRSGGGANKALLRAIVDRGEVPGLLGYRNGAPVGWVSVSPRSQYERVLRSPVHKPIDSETGVWSIACFFIHKSARRTGFADALLAAAVQYAKAEGARLLEAYPIDSGGAALPAADMWRGSLDQFLRAGFAVAACRKPARPIVRRRL